MKRDSMVSLQLMGGPLDGKRILIDCEKAENGCSYVERLPDGREVIYRIKEKPLPLIEREDSAYEFPETFFL